MSLGGSDHNSLNSVTSDEPLLYCRIGPMGRDTALSCIMHPVSWVVFKSLLTQWVGVLWSTVVGQEGNKAVRQSGNDRALDLTDSQMTPSSVIT